MLSVSVAMATYNGGEHIRQQLDSLSAQSHMPAELIITDDGSDDATLSVAADFEKISPFPVRIHRNETRLGYRGNFMRAAGLCRSELIAFCDQDDVWYPNKIKACVEQFSDPEVLLVYHDADVVSNDGQRMGRLQEFSAQQSVIQPRSLAPVIQPMSLAPMSHALGLTQVFRGWLLQLSDLWPMSRDHLNLDEPMAHDQWFFFLASVLGKIGYLNEPLVAYVQHGRNTFGQTKTRQVSPLQKLRSNLRTPADHLSQTAAAASIRADILEAIKAKVDGTRSDRAETAAKQYRRLSMFNSTRKEIYSSAAFSDRLNAFRKLLRCGAYGGTWNLSRSSLIKDMCVGIPVGPFLARSG